MTQRILIIGGYGTAFPAALGRLGAEVVLVQAESLLTPAQRAAATATIEVGELSPHEGMIERCRAEHARRPFDAVGSLTEFGVPAAAVVAEALGVRTFHPRTVVERIRDKAAMRRWMSAAGRDVGFAVCSSYEEGKAAIAELGLPVVVKPAAAWGSLAVSRVDDPTGMAGALDRVFELGEDRALVERFLDGPEYSVEAFSVEGEHVVVAITGKVKAWNLVELGHVVPAALDADVAQAINAAIVKFLDILEVRDGATHTEVICTPTGVHLVESHTRVGGDQIPTLVELAYGIDLYDWAARWLLGRLPPLVAPVRPSRAAAIAFFHAEPGRVTAVEGVRRAHDSAGVVALEVTVAPGDDVRPLSHSFDRCGSVITVGASPAQALDRARAAADAITVRTDPTLAVDRHTLSDKHRRYARGLS